MSSVSNYFNGLGVPNFSPQSSSGSKVDGTCKELFQSLQPISLCSRADVFSLKDRHIFPVLQSSGCQTFHAETLQTLATKADAGTWENSLNLSISALKRASRLDLSHDPDLKDEISLELFNNLIWRNTSEDLDRILTLLKNHPQIVDQADVRALWKVGYSLFIRNHEGDRDWCASILEQAESRLKNDRSELILRAEILCDLGNTLLVRNQKDDLNRAIKYLEIANANLLIASAEKGVQTHMVKVLCALGNAYGTRGSDLDINLAIALLTRASKLDCKNKTVMIAVLRNLALSLMKRNAPGDADFRISTILRAIELSRDASDSEKFKHLSALIYELFGRNGPGDCDLLIKTLTAATQLSLSDRVKVRLYLDLGDQLRLRNDRHDLDKSIEAYRRAVKIDPAKCAKLCEALLQRGGQKDIAEANALLKKR